MKKVVLFLLFSASAALMAQAQEQPKTDSYPYWTISKDVQRMQFKNIKFEPSTIVTGNGAWVISKGKLQPTKQHATGTVATNGQWPTWTISKGAARMAMERR